MDVLGVRVELPNNQPIVLLKEREGSRHLPIWIGAAEASAIAYAQQGVVPPRPLTHDLMADLLVQLGASLRRVEITELKDGAFHAVLVLSSESGHETRVDSRSSDAIALALRAGAPIEAGESLLAEVGVTMAPEAEVEGGETGDTQSEDVLAEFKEFLDSVSPEDFETGEQRPN